MRLDRVQGIAEICHAFRGGLADACGPDALENLLAVLEGRADVFKISGEGAAATMQVSLINGDELRVNALSGRIPSPWLCRDLWRQLAAACGAKVIRGRVNGNERLAAMYKRMGATVDGTIYTLPVGGA